MSLMKTLLTSACVNQRQAGQFCFHFQLMRVLINGM
jgi:hypothetical protein